MIEAMETLLLAWGAEVISPRLDVSIRSPLAAMSDDAPGGGTGGSRCLSTVECAVVMSRATAAVDAALVEMATDERGLGSRGRVLQRLAGLRYAEHPRLQVAAQCRLLAVSVRTYRTRVDELHVELAAALPGVMAARVAAEQALPAYAAARARLKLVRAKFRQEAAAARESVLAVERRRAKGEARIRAQSAAVDGAA